MRFSYGLPTHRVDVPEFLTAAGIAELTSAAEGGGFDAVFATEHPFPSDSWMANGGHHALDPLIALTVGASTSNDIRLHTNLFIPAYRNPFLSAKAISTLDVISDGRVILGVGAGYVRDEFDALGAPYDRRNEALDEALAAMRLAWSGESVTDDGPSWNARGNTMLPAPAQRPHPPVWIGGNSRRAMRRAAELGDGWSPFPAGAETASAIQTGSISTVDQLSERIEELHEMALANGREEPLDVCFVPRGLRQQRERPIDAAAVTESCHELAEIGVTWVTVALPGDSLRDQRDAIEVLASEVIPHVTDA